MKDHAYRQALEAMTGRHAEVIATALRIRPGFLKPGELAVVVEYHLGEHLREIYRQQEFLATDHLLAALDTLPAENRHPRAVVEALEWHDRNTSLKRRLDQVATRGPLFQPAVERALRKHRRASMRHSLREMNRNHRALAMAVNVLLDAMHEPGALESMQPWVQNQLEAIGGMIEFGEWHARAAATWALLNRVPTDSISDSLVRLYIRPMQRISDLLVTLEDRLELSGDQRCSAAASRASCRIAVELMDAAEVAGQPLRAARRDVRRTA